MLGGTAPSGTDTSSSAQHSVTGRELASSWLYPCLERASTTSVRTEEEKAARGGGPREEEEEDVAGAMLGEKEK